MDTGATNHIVHSITLFTTIASTKHCVVELPNGETAMVTHIGSVQISAHLILENDLCSLFYFQLNLN